MIRVPVPGAVDCGIKLVKPSETDLKARQKALKEVVLSRWAKRCGEAWRCQVDPTGRQPLRSRRQGELI